MWALCRAGFVGALIDLCGGGGVPGQHHISKNYILINCVSILKNACFNHAHLPTTTFIVITH